MLRSFKASAVICLVLVLVICISPVARAASWTTIVPADYISDTYYVGSYRYVVYDLSRSAYIQLRVGTHVSKSMDSMAVTHNVDHTLPMVFTVYPLGAFSVGGPPLTSDGSGAIAIDVSDFKPNACMTVTSNITLQYDIYYWSNDIQLDERFSISTDWAFYGYSQTGNYIGAIQREKSTLTGTMQDVSDDFLFEIPISLDIDLSEFPENVAYIVPWCTLTYTTTEDEPDINVSYFKLSFDSFSFTTRTDMLLQDSLTLQEINEKLDGTNEKLDELLQHPENEKQEASQDGNDLIGQLTGVLPNKSQGFMDAIRSLADSMSYAGTDAILTFPAISLPAIPGVMEACKLSDEYPIDFGFWVQKIPEPVMTLVQVVLTIGLVVYAFKEFYGLLSYAMTLKRGASE